MTASSTLPRLRQLEERQVETTVELVQWSPKMDIVAIAMKMGDLQLFRLNWQKVPPSMCQNSANFLEPPPFNFRFGPRLRPVRPPW
jgi:hypothetical protein